MLTGAVQYGHAANKIVTTATDSSNVQVRSFDKEKLAEYAKDKNFRYQETKEQLNGWQKFWSWVWYNMRRLFSGWHINDTAGLIFKYLLLTIAIGFLVFIILKLAGVDVVKIMTGKSAKTALPYTESIDNIHEIDFDKAIEEAVLAKNYRLAVRLSYLRCLKYLSDARLIDWHIEKTNADYVRELTNAPQYKVFNLLTYQFEYVWYGDFPINEQRFQQVNELFLELKKQLA